MFNTAVSIDLLKENPFSKLVKKIKISSTASAVDPDDSDMWTP